MILGVVLAGGLSSRFGSDKALAEVEGRALIVRAVDALAGWCDYTVVAGRDHAPAPCIPDWPRAGMGPLGGIAAALRLAVDEGYDAVLSLGVDSLDLPEDLLDLLAPAPAFIADQPVIGLWPATNSAAIEAILEGDGSHAMMALCEAVGARPVRLANPPRNVNRPGDLPGG